MNITELNSLLPLVNKPAQYTGGELNCVVKNHDEVDVSFAFCFPDIYEIGMSHLGMKILYSLINSTDYAVCERVFAPAKDMEAIMRERGVGLFSLETHTDVCEYDIIGFSLQYELSYTNVLNMLNLSGIPLRSKDRQGLSQLVIAGGPCTCNPEPVADFFDVILPGEGEEVMLNFIELYRKYKLLGSSKLTFLEEAAKLEGVYVPAFYSISYNTDGTLKAVTASHGAPEKVKKSIIKNLDDVFYPDTFVVPFTEIVHDRAVHEIFRGCIRGCRFCQAGFIYRPVREKSVGTVSRQSKQLCGTTGYDELSLCSLSSSDYSKLTDLLEELLGWTEPDKINIAMPSQRVDAFSEELMKKLSGVRRSGLTFAPEAGSQRMRDVINKNITEEEMLSTASRAFAGGWTSVKLYFMLGLPGETDEDIVAIAQLAQKVVDAYYSCPTKPKGKSVSVSVSASSFVPKPFTPFQWEPQNTEEEFKRKQYLLRGSVRTRKVSLSVHETGMSFMEAVLARGDRRLSDVIEAAYKLGCTFDSWDDSFVASRWLEAFSKCDISPDFYANRKRSYEELLPWDIFDYGISKDFLIRESKKSLSATVTPSCREGCAGCGARQFSGGVCDAYC